MPPGVVTVEGGIFTVHIPVQFEPVAEEAGSATRLPVVSGNALHAFWSPATQVL